MPDVRGEGPVPATEPEYPPPKEHLGLNPTNQYGEHPTHGGARPLGAQRPGGGRPPAGADALAGESRQTLAQTSGGAWPPIEAEAKESRRR